ncbi:hypothetical protein Q7P37_006096 [Cladosporium fusiforme]
MNATTTSSQYEFTRRPPTGTTTLASGPSPMLSINCDDFHGTPLLPPFNDSYQCGTKTSNHTLMEACCDGKADFVPGDLRGFAACLSTDGNSSTAEEDVSNYDPDVFCQGNLTATVAETSDGSSNSLAASRPATLLCVVFLTLLFSGLVSADCTVVIDENSAFIRQDEARRINTGLSCPYSNFCTVDVSGTGEIQTVNRTIDGQDASDSSYDSFFEAVGKSTSPPRLFAATASMHIRHFAVGATGPELTNWPSWAPFMYCVRAEADDCSEVEGTVEACGPLYQTGTGLGDDDDWIPMGVFLLSAW